MRQTIEEPQEKSFISTYRTPKPPTTGGSDRVQSTRSRFDPCPDAVCKQVVELCFMNNATKLAHAPQCTPFFVCCAACVPHVRRTGKRTAKHTYIINTAHKQAAAACVRLALACIRATGTPCTAFCAPFASVSLHPVHNAVASVWRLVRAFRTGLKL